MSTQSYYDLAQGKLVDQIRQRQPRARIQAAGTHSFAGISDTYFAAVFLPENEAVDAGDHLHGLRSRLRPNRKSWPFAGIAVSDGDANKFRFFVGPKDIDLLKRIDPKLEQLVDFGWMAILAKPLFLIVNWANDNIVHSFGWSIILVTVVLNLRSVPACA